MKTTNKRNLKKSIENQGGKITVTPEPQLNSYSRKIQKKNE